METIHRNSILQSILIARLVRNTLIYATATASLMLRAPAKT